MVQQDPTHTPHPEVTLPLDEAIWRTLEKGLRDFAVSLLFLAPVMFAQGHFIPETFIPTLGLAVARTYRDILPELVKAIRGEG